MEERGSGDLAAVAERMRAKLIRRHPHVFGEVEVSGTGEVLSNWDRIKREQEGRGGVFTDVPEILPALLYARKLQRRAVSRAPEGAVPDPVGAPGPDAALASVREAADLLSRLARAGANGGPASGADDRDRVTEAIGELLFATVDLARRLRCDPELALRAAADRFRASAEQA